MRPSYKKTQHINILLFTISILTICQSNAQTVTAKDNNILSLSMECTNNPQCIYSKQNYFANFITIHNNSDQNLEIPVEAIKAHSTFSFKTIKTKQDIGETYPPALSDPSQDNNLTLLPAHGNVTIKGGYPKRFLKSAFHEARSNRIILSESIVTKVYYQGSSKPIGSYKDGKFEPKQFILESEKVITKQ